MLGVDNHNVYNFWVIVNSLEICSLLSATVCMFGISMQNTAAIGLVTFARGSTEKRTHAYTKSSVIYVDNDNLFL